MDDASVRKAKKDEALNQTAYLLFYQKNNGEELYCRVNNRSSSSGGNSLSLIHISEPTRPY